MTQALDLVEARLSQRVAKMKRTGDKIVACCPAHDDKNPSLGVAIGDRRDIVIKCQAGCSADAVMEALGLKWTDFGTNEPTDQATAQYLYADARRQPVFRVNRMPGKRFWQEHIDPFTGDWVKGLGGAQRVPYRLPDVLAGLAQSRPIWIAEGEKDVDRLYNEGVVATCNNGGAGNFRDSHAEPLTGATVTIVADRDIAGYDHAVKVRELLAARKCTVRVVRPAVGKDVSDHLDAGRTLDELIPIDPAADDPAATDEPAEWPEPQPLIPDQDLPVFPVCTLPAWMADHVALVAADMQVAIDLPAILGIGAISVAVTGRLHVYYPWQNWKQPCNIYATVAMPPSAGKSPAKSMMFKPLEEFEQQRITDARRQRAAHGSRVEVVRERITAARKALAKEHSTYGEEELNNLSIELYDLEQDAPPSGRMIADDATIEALGIVLADAGGSIGVVSAEGGLFDRLAGLYSDNGVNLDLYLEGWGGGRYTLDRVKRDAINVASANVSVITTVQPTTLDEIGAKKVFNARGLVARFLLALPTSNVGYRDRRRRSSVDTTAAEFYAERLTSIAHKYADDPTTLTVGDEAAELYAEWDQTTEYRLLPAGDLSHIPEWVGKLRANVLRLAGILHVAHSKTGVTIDGETMQRAIVVADYFTAHMVGITVRWGAGDGIAEAVHVLRWLERQGEDEFCVRDLHRANQRMFPSSDDLIQPLTVLVETGHIRPLFDGPITTGRGGKASPRFAVHRPVSPVSPVSTAPGFGGSVITVNKRGGSKALSLSQSNTRPNPDPVDTGDTGDTASEVDDETLSSVTSVTAEKPPLSVNGYESPF